RFPEIANLFRVDHEGLPLTLRGIAPDVFLKQWRGSADTRIHYSAVAQEVQIHIGEFVDGSIGNGQDTYAQGLLQAYRQRGNVEYQAAHVLGEHGRRHRSHIYAATAYGGKQGK